MTKATTEQTAELVGYTGTREDIEVRLCTGAKQVWDYDVDYGVGLGLGRLGYWVGTDLSREFVGRERRDVETYAKYNLDSRPVRWLAAEPRRDARRDDGTLG